MRSFLHYPTNRRALVSSLALLPGYGAPPALNATNQTCIVTGGAQDFVRVYSQQVYVRYHPYAML